ncbi:MAG TPA: hypothetical protein VN672_12185 [Solirubrobacteraceae bacterium]|nr:hypothetical protein [Solirubrobacteraceae bacterium]
MQVTFYETLALAAFALLGLWWVVVAERRREWVVLPYRRRQAYTVSLYFTITGIMSLVSLISENHPVLWRLAFGIAGGLGMLETVLSLVYVNEEPHRELRIQALLALTLPLYAIVTAVAIHPSLAADVGIHLKPLESEAVVVSLLFFLGINYAWLLFMEPAYPADSD